MSLIRRKTKSKSNDQKEKLIDKPVNAVKKITGFEEIKANFNWIKFIFDKIRNTRQAVGKKEHFEDAMIRRRVTEEQLSKIYSNFVIRLWINSAFGGLGFLIMLNAIRVEDWLTFGTSLSFIGLALSQMFIGSFRAFQIRRRSFLPVTYWFERRKEWFPLSNQLNYEEERIKERMKKRHEKKQSLQKKEAAELSAEQEKES